MTDTKALAGRFPKDFCFGVATAAYQIEGAVNEGGRGPSIWDAFSHTPGKTVNGDTGDIACDHYHRWASDLDLIRDLGMDAYRFSIAWPRVMPEGRRQINQTGLDFYDRLIDGCLERDLKVFATLYHWDLPLTLGERGGWTSRDTAYAFADYAELIMKRLGDRINAMTTFNEPWCSAMMGHLYGVFAPGSRDMKATLAAIHHQNLAHGLAVSAMRAVSESVPLGIVLNAQSVYPADDTDVDIEAASRHTDFHNGVFFEPLFNGRYPSSIVEALGPQLPEHWEADLTTIRQPLDYWGLNYYTPNHVTESASAEDEFPATSNVSRKNVPRTDIGWEIAPETLTDLILSLNQTYTLPPCYITENGACFNQDIEDEQVADRQRLDYLDSHLHAVANAMDAGADVKGYFAWSLMDNFEWAEGYTMRFGIVHVDYDTQVRTIKQSGHWYQQLVEEHQATRS